MLAVLKREFAREFAFRIAAGNPIYDLP